MTNMQHTPFRHQFKQICVVFNASKKRHDVEQYCEQVQAQMPESKIEIIPTDDLEAGLHLAQQAHAAGTDLLVAAGGDGTLLSVVNAALQNAALQNGDKNNTRPEPETSITVLPLGTGNDYAKALGIHSVADAVTTTCTGAIELADTGLCTCCDGAGNQQKIAFCSTAGVGLFAHIVYLEQYAISRLMKRLLGDGVWPFLAVGGILASHNVKTHVQIDAKIDGRVDTQIDAQVDGESSTKSIHTEMFMCELSKVARAGGFLLTPNLAKPEPKRL